MKFAAFGLFLICCHVLAIETYGCTINDEEATDFECFLDRLKEILQIGNETLQIKPIDPYHEDLVPIDIQDVITLKTSLSNIDVLGLSEYKINQGNFEIIPPEITFDITVTVNATANYENLEGDIGKFHIEGANGNIKLDARFNFGATITYGLSEDWKRMIIREIKSHLSLEDPYCRITGLFGDEIISNIYSYAISTVMPDIIHDNEATITALIDDLLKGLSNDITESWTFEEILHNLRVDPLHIGS